MEEECEQGQIQNDPQADRKEAGGKVWRAGTRSTRGDHERRCESTEAEAGSMADGKAPVCAAGGAPVTKQYIYSLYDAKTGALRAKGTP